MPIFTSLRRDGEEAANTFGRTVLTSAVAVMIVAASIITMVAPWLADAFKGFDPSTRALYIELLRINCLALVLFGASFALGEILVANRRFVFYALAPILYTGGIVLGAVLFSDRLGIHAAAWGAVAGAAAHLAIRALGTRRTTFRIRPAFAIRTPAFGEFLRLMLPRMVSHPIEPVTLTYFTILAASLGAGSVTAFNFASDYQVLPVSLIGRGPFTGGLPDPVGGLRRRGRRTYVFRAVLGRNLLTIGALTGLAAVALFVLSGVLVQVLLGGGRFGPDDVARTSAVVAAFAISIPFDALAYPLSRGLYATHDTIRQVIASFVGLVAVVAVSQILVARGILAIPLGYAAGMATRTCCWRSSSSAGCEDRSRRSAPRRGERRDDRDVEVVAVLVVALGPVPLEVVPFHLGRVLEGPRRIGAAPDARDPRVPGVQDVRAGHLGVLEQRRVGIRPEPGHDPGVGAAPGEQDGRRVRS